jgi:hypothetical protein
MLLELIRRPTERDATVGELMLDGKRICFTLEDMVREIKGRDVASWKIKGVTAIPCGNYRVTLENSPRFGPSTLTINDVPGFCAIRMHAGNTSQDTEGCILLGMLITGNEILGGTSRPAVEAVKKIVKKALDAGEKVEISIK